MLLSAASQPPTGLFLLDDDYLDTIYGVRVFILAPTDFFPLEPIPFSNTAAAYYFDDSISTAIL